MGKIENFKWAEVYTALKIIGHLTFPKSEHTWSRLFIMSRVKIPFKKWSVFTSTPRNDEVTGLKFISCLKQLRKKAKYKNQWFSDIRQ